MNTVYKKTKNCNLIKDAAYFGIASPEGKLLLPPEYDSIFCEGDGFIVTKNSKSGYVKLCDGSVKELLPCAYDRIEPKRNGLVLYSMTRDPYSSEKRAWFDLSSEKLYENLHFLRNHREFDEFLDTGKGSQMPGLKHAGKELYVTIPFDLSISILFEIPIGGTSAHYFVCTEERDTLDEYLLLIVLPTSYTFTEPYPNIMELFARLSETVKLWEKEAAREAEIKSHSQKQKKQSESSMCGSLNKSES